MKRVKKVSFRVRKTYFDKIVSGEKKEELRCDSEYWRKTLFSRNPPNVAVFVCGKRVHRRWIEGIYRDRPENVLGRPLSEQGRRDIPTETCIVVRLGPVYEPGKPNPNLLEPPWERKPL